MSCCTWTEGFVVVIIDWVPAEDSILTEATLVCCVSCRYDQNGKVVRGPAPLSLALAHAEIKDDVVFFSPWTETDFRTGVEPWWS